MIKYTEKKKFNKYKNVKLIDKSKRISLILYLMIIFSFIYYIFPDDNFSGMNNISETIKNELLKKKLLKQEKKK